MSSPQTDRRLGLAGNVALKAPVDLAVVTNITLSGEQTIQSVTTNESRVLVAGQTDATQNGIYDTSTGAWTRSYDCNGVYDLVCGSLVMVTGGTYAGSFFQVTTADTITIGTSNIAFAPSSVQLPATLAGGTGPNYIGWSAISYNSGTIGRAIENGGVTPSMYGCAGDGSTDDTTNMRAWATSGFPLRGEPKTFKVTGTITFSADTLKGDFGGMIIDGSSGTFTNNAVVIVTGTLTQISDLSASPAQGDVALSFSSAHGLVEGNVAIIYNPTNSSWSTKQTYYRAGEFFKTQYVGSSTSLKLAGGLYAGYTAANVHVYKLTQNDVNISNLTVKGPNTGTMSCIKVQLATRVRMNNIRATGTDYTGILLDRCFDVVIDGATVTVPVQVATTKYGIAVGNSQHVRISKAHIQSTRHAVNVGGDDFTGSVPNRDIWIADSYLANDMALSSNPCCDVHGNSDGVYYVKNQIKGGGTFGGKNCHYWDNDFLDAVYSGGSLVYGGSEWMGGIAEVKGGSMYGSQAYASGLVRIFTSTDVVVDSALIVEGVTVNMPACDTLARCDLGSSAYKVNAIVRNITFTSAPSLVNVLRMVGTGTGGDGDYIVVDEIANGKSGATLFTGVSGYSTSVKCRLMEQRGVASITASSTAQSANTAVTYRYSYGSRTPAVNVTLASGTIGSTHALIPVAASVGSSSFNAGFQTGDCAVTGSTASITAYWSASVAEI